MDGNTEGDDGPKFQGLFDTFEKLYPVGVVFTVANCVAGLAGYFSSVGLTFVRYVSFSDIATYSIYLAIINYFIFCMISFFIPLRKYAAKR